MIIYIRRGVSVARFDVRAVRRPHEVERATIGFTLMCINCPNRKPSGKDSFEIPPHLIKITNEKSTIFINLSVAEHGDMGRNEI